MSEAAQHKVFYKAMVARDPRFDGKFFVAVRTTGIYCRPICPAKPKLENVEFFASALSAEHAGYRPCLRCRPEAAPDSAAWLGTSALVQRALRHLRSPDFTDASDEDFAARFGVSARHLRRLFVDEFGKTPKQLQQDYRLNLARQMLTETLLPVTEIAFASGFRSIRTFNTAFLERFARSPSAYRADSGPAAQPQGWLISLAYRPPFDFDWLLHHHRRHRIESLEWFDESSMSRRVFWKGKFGIVQIQNVPEASRLSVRIDYPDPAIIPWVIQRVRSLFDLDSDPMLLAEHFQDVPELKRLHSLYPGIRIPGGWEPFEVAIGTILGQLVSVERGQALVAKLIEIAGSDVTLEDGQSRIRLFPGPAEIRDADLSALGTTARRKQTLKDFSNSILSGELSLDRTQDPAAFRKTIQKIKGLGPWSAEYIALKALGDTNSFPSTDLILARAMQKLAPGELAALEPWRGYAAALLWRDSGHQIVDKVRKRPAGSRKKA